jgi:hypothetical protein
MAYGSYGDPTESSPEYLKYAADVKALGGLAVRLPAQSGHEGKLGARFPRAVIQSKNMKAPLVWTTGQQYGYYLAPRSLLVSDYIQGMRDAATIRAGETAETLENVAKGVLGFTTFAALGIGAVILLAMRRGGK